MIKICDFGWCVQSDASQQRSTFCGTLEYMAPEMLNNRSHNHTLDVWSLGILLFELCHGRAPFTGTIHDIKEKINNGYIRFKPGLSDDYKDLVNKILKYETTDRIPLIKIFDHPWVKNFERKYNLSKEPAAGAGAVAAADAAKQKKEAEEKKKQAAMEAKALADALRRQKEKEAEAAAKEVERQRKIAEQKREQEILQKKQEEQRRRKEEEERRREIEVAAAAAAAAAIAEQKKREEELLKELERTRTQKYLDDMQTPTPNEKKDCSDHYDAMMKDLSHLDKQVEDRKRKNDDTVIITPTPGKRESPPREKENNSRNAAGMVLSPTFSKEDRQKQNRDRVLNNSINIRSNKKAM